MKKGKQSLVFEEAPYILASANIVGTKEAGGIAGVGCDPCIAALVDDVLTLEARIRDGQLYQHRTKTLSNAGSTGIDMKLAVILHNELAATPVGKANAVLNCLQVFCCQLFFLYQLFSGMLRLFFHFTVEIDDD